MFPGYESKLAKTDPEFIERFDNFAFDEVINMPEIGGKEVDDKTRHMAILATLLGCQGIDEFKAMLPATMNFGVTPVEIKEIRTGGEPPHQSLACGQLFWRLLHQNRTGLCTEGTDYFLFPVCTGRM
jgi:hypothetical protein